MALLLVPMLLVLAACDDQAPPEKKAPPQPGSGEASSKYQSQEAAPAPKMETRDTRPSVPVDPGRLVIEPTESLIEMVLGIDSRPLDVGQSRKVLRLRNEGGTAVTAIAMVTGNPEFIADSACLNGLQPDETCLLTVTWNGWQAYAVTTPATAGGTQTGTGATTTDGAASMTGAMTGAMTGPPATLQGPRTTRDILTVSYRIAGRVTEPARRAPGTGPGASILGDEAQPDDEALGAGGNPRGEGRHSGSLQIALTATISQIAAPDPRIAARAAMQRARAASVPPPGQVDAGPPAGWGPDWPRVDSSLPVDRTRILTTDRVINAVLERGVDSSIPGPVVAVVESHVYGSDGRTILIPAGSRVVGAFRLLQTANQERIEMQWTRVLRPDGAHLLVDDPAGDAMGRIGVPGDVDSRFWDRVGLPLLFTLISAAGDGIAIASGADVTETPTLFGTSTTTTGSAAQKAAARAGQNLSKNYTDFARQILNEQLGSIKPVVRIAQGARIEILPTTDLWIRDTDTAEGARIVAVQRARVAPVANALQNPFQR
jgi:type IV secretion system protein VirB10